MASFTPIPVPLTAEEEEEQMEFAILQSLMLDQARVSEENLWMTRSHYLNSAVSETLINGSTGSAEESSNSAASNSRSGLHVPAKSRMPSLRSPATMVSEQMVI